MILGRVAPVLHHRRDEPPGLHDRLLGLVHEPLLDSGPLARVLDAGRLVQGMDLEAPDPAFAFREFGVGLPLAVHLACHPVILRAKALPELAAAHAGHRGDHQDHQGNGHDDGNDRSG